MPLIGTSPFWLSGIPLASPPPSALLTEEIPSPGAATPTQGPAIVKDVACPPGPTAPTEST